MGDNRNPNLGVLSSPLKPESGHWRENLGKSRLDLSCPRKMDWWTGKPPVHGLCPGVSEQGKIHSLVPPDLGNCSRQEVLDYFDNTWTLTEVLFSSLSGEEAFYRPPYHGLRHPLVFYYLHPAALYINKLFVAGLVASPLDDYLERLFETGVDEMSWDDMSKNEIDWPALDELKAYRKKVYEIVVGVIRDHAGLADGHPPITQDSPLWALFMAFEHERIHLETSSVLIRELPLELVHRPQWWPDIHPSAEAFNDSGRSLKVEARIENTFLPVPPGQVTLGKPANWPTFGWDNEYGSRDQHVRSFSATRFLISNAQFWQFISAGGYQEKRFWSETGWSWRTYRNVKWPTFWCQAGPAGSHQFKLRTIFEVIPMPWSWPAVVNFHEAIAYCNWRTEVDGSPIPYRLLTEVEHQRLRQLLELRNEDRSSLVVSEPYNLNLRHGSESPVDSMNDGYSFCDLFGNVWQWCDDHFNPLPNFKVHKYYDDFSTPCFDGLHQMILGGSFASTGDEASPWARYHFRPHFFQHAGFRIAYCKDGSNGGAVKLGESADSVNRYETQQLLDQHLTLHYGSEQEQMPFSCGPREAARFPYRSAALVSDLCRQLDVTPGRVLEVGCSVGGASFALAEEFACVEAIDLSELFIDTAKRIQRNGSIEFRSKQEGELYNYLSATIPSEQRHRVNFRRADACSLPAEYVDFDAVLVANVLCRLPSPMAFLSRMGGSRGVVRKGGLLVIMSPFTWLERFTPKDVWLGGYLDENGQEVWSEDGLANALKNDFELIHRQDMPLFIAEHRRKYQYLVTLATVWRRV
jgi:5-histidylcysteine sulfoxide synthase/putative 4-mercaptohistidine N1-methyltranferase